MNDHSIRSDLPPEQEAIRAKCFHPTGMFVEFKKEEIDQSIPDRFERMVHLYPHRLAVKAGDRSLTYDELNRYANRIARAILEERGEASEPIALVFERGLDMIAAIFGVLKAGKFYVVFDPSLPLKRISYMLQDSRAALIVTNTRNRELSHKLANGAHGLLDIAEIDDALDSDNLNTPISPDKFASIVYTSGSTAKPKGVVHSHRSQLHTVMVNTNETRICCHDRMTLLHSVGFASAQAHLFQSLLNGASLWAFDLKLEGINRLAKWVKEEAITVYHSPPAVFRQLAEVIPDEEKLSSLRLIRLSGAPVNALDFDLYKKKFAPEALLQTVMNSTEANVICSFVTDGNFCFPEKGSPIGYPVLGKKILLLGDNGCEVAYGEVGEITVKSRYLTLGYWDNPEINAVKFDSGPSSDERACLTGDLGRSLPDGFLIYLGRKDSMVKIRGYRVDTSEIEAALLSYPHVIDAGVVAWEREVGEKYLAAYVVPRTNPGPRINDLRAFLGEKLPDYMVPSAFVFLESLPLTNGKLDRTALPKPEGKRPEVSQSYVSPRTEVEQELVRIWEEVLDVRPIGIHDNFFDLGGHSLAATRILSRVVRSFQVSLRLTHLFQAPTIAGLAGHITEQPSVRGVPATFDPVRKHPEIESCPLSLTQQRLWFLHQLEPESCAYNLLSVTLLTGPLDVTALKQSLDKVIERHEVLRTIFIADDGKAQQVILPSVAIDLTVVDLRQTANGALPEAEVSALAMEFAQIPFDLARGPLLRVRLLRLAQDQYVLLHAIHHIVYDAWSIGIFARDVSNFYNAIVKGEAPAVQGLSIQYGDFSIWQHEMFQESELQDDLEYWKRQLADLTTLQMPTDYPRLSIQTDRGGKKSFVLNEALTAAIKKLSRNENATLFITLLAAFQTLLHRYTSQDDIVVGTAIDGRPQRETEEVIGFFLNTLVIRTQFSGNPTFRELLERVREICLRAFNHRHLPFEKVVEELHPERNLSYNPLFRVAFAFQNTPQSTWQLSGVAAQKWELDSGIAHFDLHLFMEEEGQTLKGSAIFNTDLFDAETISRLLDHFHVLLEGIVADPDQRVADLPILSEAEKHQLLVEWNNTGGAPPSDKCIHHLFEAQVERTPNAPAVAFEGTQLTYKELNARANQLAHYLQKLGVGPEVLVGLCAVRSLEMVVALLGILKAGGAYLPLEPAWPTERLAFMLKDGRTTVLLTQQPLLKQLLEATLLKQQDSDDSTIQKRNSQIQNPIAVCLDSDWDTIARERTDNPVGKAEPESMAYVIYTSGSTGRPKGVMVEHRQILNYVNGIWDRCALLPGASFAMVQPLSVDSTQTLIFPALISGGCLHVISEEKASNPQALSEYFCRFPIDLLKIAPSHLAALQTSSHPEQLLPHRWLVIGGEASRRDWLEKLQSTATDCAIFNHYGPTEATVGMLTYRAGKDQDTHSSPTVPMGRPLPNTQAYLLDRHLQPVPIGVPGELHIGGRCLARGYLNRPELTAENFIPNPFSAEPGTCLYKTGDLARYLPDGNIEFIGRTDDQVKIRGFRIELGEIETVLRQHPDVRASVVLAWLDAEAGMEESDNLKSDKRLVAYVVPKQERAPTVSELRSFLSKKLPAYMLPSAFVLLDGLPRTPHGKVDRQALPAPDRIRPDLKDARVAPRTETEKVIAAIWAEVLKLKHLGVHDNFFDLGGHSLLATQVISRVHDAFHVELPLRALFEKPTVASLAAQIAQAQAHSMVPKEMTDELAELETLSDEEVERLLAQESSKGI